MTNADGPQGMRRGINKQEEVNVEPKLKQENPLIKLCDKCKRECEILISNSNPKSSEWYCPFCHKSYSMPEELAEAVIEYEKKKRGKKK